MPLDPIALSDILTARVSENDLRAIVLRLRYEELEVVALAVLFHVAYNTPTHSHTKGSTQ